MFEKFLLKLTTNILAGGGGGGGEGPSRGDQSLVSPESKYKPNPATENTTILFPLKRTTSRVFNQQNFVSIDRL